MGAVSAAGDAAAIRNRDEELQIDQVEAAFRPSGILQPSSWTKAYSVTSTLCLRWGSVNLRPCPSSTHSWSPLPRSFLFAGFIKGVIGLGLPTVSVSLLAVAMPPGKALAIVIVPAILTNIIVRRLWPLLVCTAFGIWLNAGALSGPTARYGTIVLGILLVIYAVTGLAKLNFHVAGGSEKWIGGIVGLISGMISAASGVQVIPSVPYMQAIGMEKDERVQALGVFFTVATLALGFTLTRAGLVNAATALPGAVAMGSSFAGVLVGQTVRSKMPAEAFRRRFLVAMILLGIYLACTAVWGMKHS
jgi:uncharacterized protein